MKLTPVKNYIVHYPDKEQVDLNKLLLRHRPNRWKASGAVVLLLGALAVSQLTGCDNAASSIPLQTTSPQTAARKMNMAPIFEGIQNDIHDEPFIANLSFQGLSNNIVLLGNYPGPGDLSPLTEETALAIIQATLEEQGLTSMISQKVVDVPISDGSLTEWTFDLNIIGAQEPIYVEFLPQDNSGSTKEHEERIALNLPGDSKGAAIALREKLSEVHDESTGVVFYANDSFFVPPEYNLAEQVNEFVEWLKTMGLI